MDKKSLDQFFYAKSIAVVGASDDPQKAGYQIFHNLITQGYSGKAFPVNPGKNMIQGCLCFSSILDIPGKLDLVVITIPAKGVLAVVDQMILRGDAHALVLISAGFRETKTEEGAFMERTLVEKTQKAGIRVFGPNCTGVIIPETHIDTTIEAGVEQRPGSISIFSQSGAMAGSLLMIMADQPSPLGFSKYAHVGNMCDVDMLDVLSYYGQDDSTNVVCLYVEGCKDGREMIRRAAEVSKKKAVLALKVGRNEIGGKAAFSHTGSVAGKDEIYEAAFRKCGITRVDSLFDMVDVAKAMSMQSLPRGNRICILTEAGGPGSMAMDELGQHPGLQLAHISEEGRKKIKRLLPDMAMVCEPDGYIDMSAAAMAPHHADVLEAVLEEDGVDAVVFVTVPPNFLPPEDIARAVIECGNKSGKPVISCFLAGKWVRNARGMMEEAGWPTVNTSEQAVRVLTKMVERSEYLHSLPENVAIDDSEERNV